MYGDEVDYYYRLREYGPVYSLLESYHYHPDVDKRKLSNSDIYYYIDNYRPFDKAGSYGIQDWFSVQVKKVDGCYFNVMGLPLAAFFKEYRRIKKQLEIL